MTMSNPTDSVHSICDEAAREQADSVRSEYNPRSVLTIVGAASAAFCTVGFLNAFGVMIDWYQEHQLSDRSTFDITWLGSFSSFMFFVSCIPAGILVDRTGPTILLVIGSIITLFSMFMISICTKYYQFFLAQGTLLGIGQAFLTIPALAVVNQHFDKHRGLATGFTIAGSSLGGIVWPLVLDDLLNKDGVSFGWTMRTVAFIMIPLTLIPSAVVHGPVTSALASDNSKSARKRLDVSILRNPVFLTFTAGLGVFWLGMFSPQYFITSYAVSIGTSTSFGYYLVSILNAASLVGRVSGGWLADKYGCFNLASLAALSSALVAFCWTAAHSPAGLITWSLAYGFASGCIMNFQAQCAAKLATPSTYGTAIGMTLGIVSITGLFGSPISGKLLEYGYCALSMYAGAALVAGGLLMTWARFQLSHQLWSKV